jgi:hypothetical protein
MRVRTLALVAAVLTLAACGWTQSDFDAGRDRANPLETKLTPENVGGLDQHTVAVAGHPITSYFVVGNWLIVNTDAGATAYDRNTCPRSDDGPCAPVWARPGQQFRSSGPAVMFFSTGPDTFDAVDFAGRRLWSGVPVSAPPYSGTPRFAPDAFAIVGSNLLVTVDADAGQGNRTRTMNVFPLGGCGSSSCAPASHYDLASLAQGDDPRFPAGTHTVMGGLYTLARDLATGAVRWTSPCCSVPVVLHGRDAYATTLLRGPFVVFDVAGQRGCAGTPRVCEPVRTLSTDTLYAVSDTLAVGQTRPTSSTVALALFATDGRGCSGTPATCSPLATTEPLGGGLTDVAVTPRLIFAGAAGDQGTRLVAFDADLRTGCTGTPAVCAPLVSVPISSNFAGSIEVWDGHVYALADDGVLHAFALPAASG